MTNRTLPLLLALWIAPAIACSGPVLLAPGGELEGPTLPTPASWAFTDGVDTVQLETLPSDPYSVNIWVTALDEHLYVHAGTSRSQWVENLEADPRVRLRVDGSIYELQASRVEGQDEFDRFSAVYEEKYGNPPRNGSVSEAYLFRLAPR